MTSENGARWRKSSRSSGNGGNCVELAADRGRIRDSKNPAGPVLRVAWGALVAEIQAGRFGG